MNYMAKDTLEKTKENILLNLDDSNFVREFKFGNYKVIVKAPSILEEAKISIRKYDVIRKLVEVDEDFKNYMSTLEVKEIKLEEDGKLKTEISKLNLNLNSHLENVFSNINNVYQDLILRLAYLDVVIKEVVNFEGETVISGSIVQNLNKFLELRVRLTSLSELTNLIVEWVDSLDVDPFLLKN